jgi:hypothetical protein
VLGDTTLVGVCFNNERSLAVFIALIQVDLRAWTLSRNSLPSVIQYSGGGGAWKRGVGCNRRAHRVSSLHAIRWNRTCNPRSSGSLLFGKFRSIREKPVSSLGLVRRYVIVAPPSIGSEERPRTCSSPRRRTVLSRPPRPDLRRSALSGIAGTTRRLLPHP